MSSPVEKTKRGRGRPPAFEREAALKRAMDLFWRQGFEAVSVAELAEAMGIQRSSFYNSFGAREEVFRDALRIYAGLAPDAGLAALGPEDTVGPALRDVFRRLCRERSRDREGRGCLIVNAIGELVGTHPELGEEISAMAVGQSKRLRRLLRQAVKQGETTAIDDPNTAAHAFMAFLTGLNSYSKVERREATLWRACDDFLTRYGF